jgi:hypothetical protein
MDRIRVTRRRSTSAAALAAALAVVLLPAERSLAHSPVFDCFLDGPDKITCEGGFSDGASAVGILVRVLDKTDRVLMEGKIDVEGRFSFPKPKDDYHVFFDAGAGHTVTVFSADITE